MEMLGHLYISINGSKKDFPFMGGFEVAGAGVHLPAAEVAFDHSVWGSVEEHGDDRLERCRAVLHVPGGLADCSAC